MGRTILAIIAGIIAGSAAVFIIEMINTSMFPIPEGLDLSDKENMKDYIANLPTAGMVMIIIAHAIGALVAGFVASIISTASRSDRYKHGLIAAGLIVLSTVVNLFTFPHPIWVSIIDVLAVIGGGMIGSRMGAERGKTV